MLPGWEFDLSQGLCRPRVLLQAVESHEKTSRAPLKALGVNGKKLPWAIHDKRVTQAAFCWSPWGQEIGLWGSPCISGKDSAVREELASWGAGSPGASMLRSEGV